MAYATSILGDYHLAEDAAQEAFVRAHRTGLDNIEKLPGWLLVVGTREVFRKAKKARREDEIWASLPPRDDGFEDEGAELDRDAIHAGTLTHTLARHDLCDRASRALTGPRA